MEDRAKEMRERARRCLAAWCESRLREVVDGNRSPSDWDHDPFPGAMAMATSGRAIVDRFVRAADYARQRECLSDFVYNAYAGPEVSATIEWIANECGRAFAGISRPTRAEAVEARAAARALGAFLRRHNHGADADRLDAFGELLVALAPEQEQGD